MNWNIFTRIAVGILLVIVVVQTRSIRELQDWQGEVQSADTERWIQLQTLLPCLVNDELDTTEDLSGVPSLDIEKRWDEAQEDKYCLTNWPVDYSDSVIDPLDAPIGIPFTGYDPNYRVPTPSAAATAAGFIPYIPPATQ